MGYLYLTVALFAGIVKGFCGKKISNKVDCLRECIFVNLLRTFFCALAGLVVICISGESLLIEKMGREIPIYILSATSISVFCVCWMYAYKNEAYIFLSVFTMLGTIITCFFSLVFYDEKISFAQWVGMAIILFAVFLMSIYNKGIKGKLMVKDMVLLIVGCLGSATFDFSQKVYVREIGNETTVFNFYTYVFAFVMLFIIYLFTKKKQYINKEGMESAQIWICFIMSVALYINSAAKTVAAEFLSSAQIYPVLQGANLILSAILAHIIFKEKINLKSVAGMACAFLGLMIMRI